MIQKGESKIEDSDSESTTFIHKKDSNPCQHCEGSNVYRTAVVKCRKCFWHDNCEICPVCSHNIPIDQKHVKEELKRCFDRGAVTHYNRKKSEDPPEEEEGD